MTDIGIRDISVSFRDNKISNISLVQGDALTRGFDITFVNAKGETLPVDDDYVVELIAVNSKDKDTPYACRHEVVDDKYRVMIPPEALSESGSVTIQLVFYQKSTKAVIHTIKQKCPVYQSIGQEFVESNNLYIDITALRLGLEKIENLVADIQNKLDNGDFIGEKGEQGIQGPKGDQGDPGSDANVTETNIVAALGFTPVSSSRVLTDVPVDAEFTDTVTTINGKTGAISKADIVALGIPAQDTDTTYTEITTAEIDAGTASTLRAITARRLKYLLDKIVALFPSKTSELTNDSGFLTSVTKSDVGLGNVDNIKQMPISNGVLENYREKLVTLSGTSTAINLSLGNVFTHSLTGNTTYTITNAVSGQAHSFTLIINQATTVRTITFPASVKWQGGEIPDLSTASKTYILTFLTIDGGTTWLGMFGGEF